MGEIIKEQRLDEMDILENIINPINRKEIKTKELAIKLDVTEKELKKHIKDNGYIWQGNKYIKEEDVEKKIKVQVDKEETEGIYGLTGERVKVTYRIDKDLHKLVKIQAMVDETDNASVIEKAIMKYASEKAKGILNRMLEEK